jgi:hypothetical protein
VSPWVEADEEYTFISFGLLSELGEENGILDVWLGHGCYF